MLTNYEVAAQNSFALNVTISNYLPNVNLGAGSTAYTT
jgi:hypothetical protein